MLAVRWQEETFQLDVVVHIHVHDPMRALSEEGLTAAEETAVSGLDASRKVSGC